MRKSSVYFSSIVVALFLFAGCEDENPENAFDSFYKPVIEANNFVDSITNPYFPFKTGDTLRYSGTDGGVTETIEVTPLSLTKVIMGVTCMVVQDRGWENGVLAEDTYDWYAQDMSGAVWYFGEDSKQIKNGKVVGTEGSWEAGVDNAQPGIVMWNDPCPGIPYRQEYYYDEAEDWGQVIDILDSVAIGIGVYYDVVKTKEWTPLEPDVSEYKYYAPDVGLIMEEVASGGSGKIELVEIISH